MNDRAIILANGSIKDPVILQRRLEEWRGALVIAADGGSLHAGTLGLNVDIVIGDLDSLDDETLVVLSAGGARIETVPSQKDETDLELALIHATEQGAKQIAILGAFGGRLDMSLSNLFLLIHPQLIQIHIELWHGHQTAWLIRPPGDEIHGQVGDTLSLIPLNGDARVITTHNLAYPLRDETLPFGLTRGVSNVLTSPIARIDLRGGTLLAVHTSGEI